MLFSLVVNFAIVDFILSNLRWKTFVKLSAVRVMNHKFGSSALLLKGDTLGRREA